MKNKIDWKEVEESFLDVRIQHGYEALDKLEKTAYSKQKKEALRREILKDIEEAEQLALERHILGADR